MPINGDPSIALFAYNRPHHLEECISGLHKNAESSRTTLYCFLDGPRDGVDILLVEEVRRIASRATSGFLKVHIVERDHHWGLSGNIIDGITQVLKRHEQVVVVEDDLVVSPTFLRYMNRALDLYRSAPGVFSISGYNYPQRVFRIPAGYPYDAFFVSRHMCWGWGTWRDRWEKADWQIRDYASLSKNESWKRSFRESGLDLPGMLDAQMHGQVDSWAIRWTYTQFIHNAVCLVPVESLVNNMGADGSGIHMRFSARYFHPTLSCKNELRLPPFIYIDPLIAQKYKKVERRSLLFRGVRKFSKLIRFVTWRDRRPHPGAEPKIRGEPEALISGSDGDDTDLSESHVWSAQENR